MTPTSEIVSDANLLVGGLLKPGDYDDNPPEQRKRDYTAAAPYIERMRAGSLTVHIPEIAVVEVCATIRRRAKKKGTSRALAAKTIIARWQTDGRMVIHHLDVNKSIDAALEYGTGGVDSVYIGLAESLGLELKTSDGDVLKKYPNASPP